MKRNTFILALVSLFIGCTENTYQEITQSDIDRLALDVSFEAPYISLPSFPGSIYSIADFGADATGQNLCTNAIQAAIDTCYQNGGGTVIFPAGIYLTGPIELKSHVRLHTEYNCFVLFSPDFNLYPIYDTSFEGLDTKRSMSPIHAFNAENIAITGHGTFNGSGDSWRPLKRSKVTDGQWKKQLSKGGTLSEDGETWYPTQGAVYASNCCPDQNVPIINGPITIGNCVLPEDEAWNYIHAFLRPVMIHFVNCKNVLLEGVCFENSPAWNIHPLMCENVVLNNLVIRNPWYSQNGDGVDIESCNGVVINNCSFDVGDDAICMKSGKNESGRNRGIPTQNVIVSGCTVYHGHGGFVVGSEMSGGVKNVHVTNCLFIGTDVGLRFKSTRGRGGIVENIYIDHIKMWGIPNEALLFDLFYGGKAAGEETEEEYAKRMNVDIPDVDEGTPQFRDIYISDIVATDIERAMYFNGLPEMKIENIRLSNILISANQGALIRQTKNLHLSNVNIKTTDGNPFRIAPSVENISWEND